MFRDEKYVLDVHLTNSKYCNSLFTEVLWIRIHRIRMFLGLPGSGSVIIFLYLISIRILPSISKKSKKNLGFYYFFYFFLTFYL